MKKGLLGIVRAKEFSENLDREIRITENKNCPYIQYKTKNESGNTEIKTVNKLDVPLAKASDLEYLLKTRAWNTPERKYIDSNKNLCIVKETGTLDFIPVINPDTEKGVILNSIGPNDLYVQDNVSIDALSLEDTSTISTYITPLEKTRKIISRIRQIESNWKRENNITDDTLYSILTRNQDKLTGGSVDIICQGSSVYTNIVNLNHYIDIISLQNIIVKLGICYSKQVDKTVEEYFKEISFVPFHFTNEFSKGYTAVSDNFVREINNDITIEYINGCIRLFSTNDDVIECIINFCHLNYE